MDCPVDSRERPGAKAMTAFSRRVEPRCRSSPRARCVTASAARGPLAASASPTEAVTAKLARVKHARLPLPLAALLGGCTSLKLAEDSDAGVLPTDDGDDADGASSDKDAAAARADGASDSATASWKTYDDAQKALAAKRFPGPLTAQGSKGACTASHFVWRDSDGTLHSSSPTASRPTRSLPSSSAPTRPRWSPTSCASSPVRDCWSTATSTTRRDSSGPLAPCSRSRPHGSSSNGLMRDYYVHLVANASPGFEKTATAVREGFGGLIVRNGGFDADRAELALAEGRAELVSFGRPFIANPDLVDRMKLGASLSAPDPTTFYTPGAQGYVDYPSASMAQTSRPSRFVERNAPRG
jgi:NADH:flavin oxidoreductase / NADH oxidase family